MEEKDRMRRENVQNSENALKDTYEKKLSEEQVEQDEVGIDEEKLTEEQMKEIGAVIRRQRIHRSRRSWSRKPSRNCCGSIGKARRAHQVRTERLQARPVHLT